MSTNSTITVKCPDDKLRSIYCHWDGYLEVVGKELLEKYNNQELAELLVSDGDRCIIIDTILSYRPRGEDCPTKILSSLSQVCKQDFNYYWNGGRWVELDNPDWNSNILEVTADNLPDALALIIRMKAELARLKGQ